MLPWKTGQKWFFRDPIWQFAGEVEEVGPTYVTFRKLVLVHSVNDLGRFLSTGKFASGDEATALPSGSGLSSLFIAEWFPFLHEIPSKGTHTQTT